MNNFKEQGIITENNTAISRRLFLKGLAATALIAGISSHFNTCEASPGKCFKGTPRDTLSFFHTHTEEILTIPYPLPRNSAHSIMQDVNYFLRDFRTGNVHDIDPELLDILFNIKRRTDGRTFQVISGYRSPATNRMLRKRSHGVAKYSLHMSGKAIDIRLTGVDTLTVRNCALALKRGGVGYYRKSDFVHVDSGRFRYW